MTKPVIFHKDVLRAKRVRAGIILTAEDVAAIEVITPCRVRELCRKGKIIGAKKWRHMWLIQPDYIMLRKANGRPRIKPLIPTVEINAPQPVLAVQKPNSTYTTAKPKTRAKPKPPTQQVWAGWTAPKAPTHQPIHQPIHHVIDLDIIDLDSYEDLDELED